MPFNIKKVSGSADEKIDFEKEINMYNQAVRIFRSGQTKDSVKQKAFPNLCGIFLSIISKNQDAWEEDNLREIVDDLTCLCLYGRTHGNEKVAQQELEEMRIHYELMKQAQEEEPAPNNQSPINLTSPPPALNPPPRRCCN
jgi:hypothetical protein